LRKNPYTIVGVGVLLNFGRRKSHTGTFIRLSNSNYQPRYGAYFLPFFKLRDGIPSVGQQINIHQSGELGREQGENQCCCSCCRASCCSDWPSDSSGHCCSSCPPDSHGSSLSGQNPKAFHYHSSERTTVTSVCKGVEWLHMPDQFPFSPFAFIIIFFILPEFV